MYVSFVLCKELKIDFLHFGVSNPNYLVCMDVSIGQIFGAKRYDGKHSHIILRLVKNGSEV